MQENRIIIGKRSGMSNFFRQFQTHLDVSSNTYKIQESLFGLFKWGDFEILPKIDHILVFRQLYAKCEDCTLDDFENSINSYYQISLIHNKTRRIVVHETRSKSEAFEMANKLSVVLNKRILDAVTDRRKGKWIA